MTSDHSRAIDKHTSISACSHLEAGNSKPECPQSSAMQLSTLNLAAGVGDVEYLTNCIMLHNQLKHGLAELTNFGCRDQQMEML